MQFSREILVLLLLIPSFSSASGVTYAVNSGFGTGELFLSLSESEQRSYAVGVINGMLVAPMFGAQKKKMRWFEQCIQNMTDSQVTSILVKFLRDNPGRWHETPHVPMFTALKEACPK